MIIRIGDGLVVGEFDSKHDIAGCFVDVVVPERSLATCSVEIESVLSSTPVRCFEVHACCEDLASAVVLRLPGMRRAGRLITAPQRRHPSARSCSAH